MSYIPVYTSTNILPYYILSINFETIKYLHTLLVVNICEKK
jgi:hypothetical protein